MLRLLIGFIAILTASTAPAAENAIADITLICNISGSTSESGAKITGEQVTISVSSEENEISASGLMLGKFNIDSVMESTISFSSDAQDNSFPFGIAGSLNRYTGEITLNDTDMGHGLKLRLTGTCEVAERLF